MSIQTQLDRIKDNVTAAFNAVGNKGGTVPSSKVSDNLESAINTIPSGVVLEELKNPGFAETLMQGYELYDDGGTKVTGTLPFGEQGTPVISDVDSNGIITASVKQKFGVIFDDTKSATKKLPTVPETTIEPGTSEKTAVPAGVYTTGDVKIAAIPTVTRANTTITTTADDTNDKLTITASNNQTTGYVTGANKTASKTITLTASGATVTASDGEKSISKSVTTATQATPSISVSESGLITASAAQSAGYVSSGTKSNTEQLTVQAAQNIRPGTNEHKIPAGRYLTGDQIILGDANLVAENIKDGVSIFNVLGTFVGSGGGSGGLPDGFSALTGGTLTPASDTPDGSLNYIDHDLGTTPNFFMIAMNCTVSPADHAGYLLYSVCFKSKIGNNEVIGYTTRTASNGSMSQSIMNYPGMGSTMFTDTQFSTFGSGTSKKAGVEYAWLCGVLDNLV